MDNNTTKTKLFNYVYVSNIPHSYAEHELKKLFSKFGRVLACIVTDDHSKRHGIVTMESESAAYSAVSELHGTPVNGKTIFLHTTNTNQLPRYEERKSVPV